MDLKIHQEKRQIFTQDGEKENLRSRGRAAQGLSHTCLQDKNKYVDRYFTSFILLDKPREKGILGTETITLTRFIKHDFSTDQELVKLGRGIIKSIIKGDKKLMPLLGGL